ncbi:family 43 glycosylhydrolase [Prevotella sp. PMUR]|uniref:Family 43 glycosylhydrolase n=2 Tax=Xylanibacter muris TaxID=2736290 RepID=A0ABX2AKR2_9BACT|nr:family 43 glycosylhydrolase [Xylanibacter muris]
MNRHHLLMAVAAVMLPLTQSAAQELNMPVIQTKYTADPAPMVHNDTVYLYTTHDENDAEGFHMKDWLLYTSTDMVNWQDRGAVASLENFEWFKGKNGAWAEQVIERNGKWYMYCPIHGHGIGVLTSDSPYGPFKDPIGKPLVWQKEHWYDIDPTVFIDDDGQAYMYWGNPKTYYVKLNKDMISYSGEIVEVPHIKDYQEGPWCYKRNGHYYMAFASTCCPEGIGYAMSKSPTGPWEYKGHIMNHTHRTRGNHPGIIDYKGKSYCFGLNYDIFRLETSRHAERRSVSVAEMTYNADGTIQELPYFLDCKLEQIEHFNPFRKVEAETMAWGYGLETVAKNPWGKERWNQLVTGIDNGEYIQLKGVDFAKGATSFKVCASCHLYGGTMEIRLDGVDGKLIGSVNITNTKTELKVFETKIKGATGVHDLYFVFKGSEKQKRNLFNLDWWEFK